MFVAEFSAGLVSGSTALLADSLDLSADGAAIRRRGGWLFRQWCQSLQVSARIKPMLCNL